MAITNQQFETWAKQGAIATSKATGESIKRAINSYGGFPDGVTYEVYLQGSYKNNTNSCSESDVDVVVQKTSAFYSNLDQTNEDLLALADDIWLSIDHNDNEALKKGVGFKTEYNEKVAAFDQLSGEISQLVQNYMGLSLEQEEQSTTDNKENQRIIKSLDRHEKQGFYI
jgi:hypothetical protein